MRKHTCDELGVCQGGVAECHLPCTPPPTDLYPFAPGVIDGPHGSEVRLTARRALTELAVLLVTIAVLGISAGYLATRLGWVS